MTSLYAFLFLLVLCYILFSDLEIYFEMYNLECVYIPHGSF